MTNTLRHRGPDDKGVWVDGARGIALGHRRLSVLDLSSAGHQPMLSADGRYVIAYNGEIYNHLELRRKLGDSPPASRQRHKRESVSRWRGQSDTETLLECIVHWGLEDTLDVAVGMFAFALWDRDAQILTLARDRIGEKPLYYGWQGHTFLFGSELKALRAHPAFQPDIDRGALALLLRHNYIPAPHSIYRDILKLPAGTFLQVDANQGQHTPAPRAYWSLSDVAERGTTDAFSGSDEEAANELERLLGTAVRRQMLADVPLGSLLSGGIDSTLITALMQRHSSQPVRTFTIGFEEHAYDETAHARSVAKHLGTEHTELRLRGEDALALVPQMPTMYDEPFADCSQLPTHLVMKLARKHVTAALSGDAGDEVFGGYNRYVRIPQIWSHTTWMPRAMRAAIGTGLRVLPSNTVNRILGPLATRAGIAQPGDKAHKLGHRLQQMDSIDDLYFSLVSEWQQSERIVSGASTPPYLLGDREHWPNLADPVARMMSVDSLTYLPDDILVKVDRAAMAVSLETRAPFLDHNVIEFAWSLPMNMKIRNGQSKWILRLLLDRHVPRTLMDRPKMGFGIPIDDWLRGPLRNWADKLLSDERLRDENFFDAALINSAWRAHLDGQGAFGHRLWSVLMFQAWLEAGS